MELIPNACKSLPQKRIIRLRADRHLQIPITTIFAIENFTPANPYYSSLYLLPTLTSFPSLVSLLSRPAHLLEK